MFLCALDGKLYSDDTVYQNIVLKQYDKYDKNPKTIEAQSCCLCYGLLNTKYKLDTDNSFIVPSESKTKIYKISCKTFDNKMKDDSKDDEPKKLITQILSKMKAEERCKKSNK